MLPTRPQWQYDSLKAHPDMTLAVEWGINQNFVFFMNRNGFQSLIWSICFPNKPKFGTGKNFMEINVRQNFDGTV